jgi:phage major head subunit gpT-like protein
MDPSQLTSALLSLKGAYMFGHRSAEEADLHKQVAAITPSDSSENIYSWFGDMPAMREWLGDRVVHKLDASEYRVKNRKFELTVEIDEDKVEDNKILNYTAQFQHVGRQVALQPNKLVFDVLSNGKTLLGYDELPLFSANHVVDGATVSNYRTGAAEPWILADLSSPIFRPVIYQPRRAPRFQRHDRPTDPTVFWKGKMVWGADRRDGAAPGLWQTALLSEEALNATNFATAYQQLAAFENDSGETLGVTPTHIITGPANWAAADALFNKTHLAGGETNTHAGRVKVIMTNLFNIA